MKDIHSLYNDLYEKPSSLSQADVMLLVDDFVKRQTQIIEQGNSGVFKIDRDCKDYIFNGFLVMNPTNNAVVDFQILLEETKEIQKSAEQVVILVNCVFKRIETPTESEKKDTESKLGSDIESAIKSLERLSKLYESGAINKEEFEKLKAEILK